jgi:hypothetical protein
MAIHFRRTPMVAVLGMLALGGVRVAQAQDTTSATRSSSDTAGYQASPSGSDTSMAGRDSSTQTGAPADTALKAAPGTQTGKPAGDSSATGASAAGVAADTVVCKDGSNAANGQAGCGAHGGIDSVATRSAQKARGWSGARDSSAAGQADSSSGKSTSP